jgi:hypothetical protein
MPTNNFRGGRVTRALKIIFLAVRRRLLKILVVPTNHEKYIGPSIFILITYFILQSYLEYLPT